jgi:ABC-type bacteriocin/lantibiotic exporter with double-glycine peptidase domain
MHGRNEKSDKTANVWRSDFAIEARNVDFRYEGAIDLVLTDINLTVEAGKAVAIVGASGAGKSTLVNLLIGSLRPTSGEISVLGETPELGRSSSHTKIAFLPQNSGAITGSVFENLTFKSGVDNNEDLIVNEILTDIGLGNLAQTLPSGLESQLSPGVSQLSSGQLQRLLLGRALFAKPNLIILDEPTSSLDDSTSNLIDLSLSILKGSTTIVVITHKKPNPDLFDEVYHN